MPMIFSVSQADCTMTITFLSHIFLLSVRAHATAAHTSFMPMIFSVSQADCTMTITFLSPFSNASSMSLVSLLSSSVGSPMLTTLGKFKSSFVSDAPSSMRLTDWPSMFITWYSILFTNGTSTLCDVGQRSSYFLEVKMSKATMCAFACPCLPVLEVVTSATLHGCPLIITWLPLRNS